MFNWRKKEDNVEKTESSDSKNIESQEVELVKVSPEIMTSTFGVGEVKEDLKAHGDIDTQDQKESKPIEPATPPLTRRELKYLKRADYEKISKNEKFTKSYVIKNVRTGQIVELRAASSFHACNIIGWKPNRVRVMEEKNIEVKEEPVKA